MNNQLDQFAQRLARKHQVRLEAMTRSALQVQPATARLSWLHKAWMKPAMATAFAASLALAAVLLGYLPEKKAIEPAAFAAMPEWVKDTEVPLTLLENIAFYDWLSQQSGNPSAALQNRLVLADNQLGQSGIGGRYTTSNLAQRFSGRPAADGEAPR
ncbi:hypothetical protein [Thiothrix sp.]|jgi:hypothetical protein|uniref:hypothetical protein n=1 Tax=Thiothrix sp. TaxID=1032 RepID=UPI00257FEB16|nr:hypothetical protein [Thiothrix sp.]